MLNVERVQLFFLEQPKKERFAVVAYFHCEGGNMQQRRQNQNNVPLSMLNVERVQLVFLEQPKTDWFDVVGCFHCKGNI